MRIDGIDAFPQESPLLEWAYDSVRVADVLTMTPGVRDYDLVLLGDVIEHIDKEAGRRLLGDLLERNRCVVVSTPREFFDQHDIGGNPYERHVSHWRADDFASWPADIDVRGGTLIAALRGWGGSYPTDGAVRVSQIVRRVPGLRDRGATSTAVKEALRSYVLRR